MVIRLRLNQTGGYIDAQRKGEPYEIQRDADGRNQKASAPAPTVPAEVSEQEVVIRLDDRRYRVRGLAKNLAYDDLRINAIYGTTRVGQALARFQRVGATISGEGRRLFVELCQAMRADSAAGQEPLTVEELEVVLLEPADGQKPAAGSAPGQGPV